MTPARSNRAKIASFRPDRLAAVALLVILSIGLGITTFTHGWIAALPQHEHLFIGELQHGLHHSHPGDGFDRAAAALESVPSAGRRAGVAGERVISTRATDAGVPELNAYTFGGAIATVAPVPAAGRGPRRLSTDTSSGAGQTPAPLAPPPQAA